MIFVDKLNILSFIKIIKLKCKRVYILSSLNNMSTFLKSFLELLGIEVNQEIFFYGDLRTDQSESLYIATRKKSIQMSFEYSNKIIDSSVIYYQNRILNERNIFKSYLSKILLEEFEYFFRRIDYIKNQYPTKDNIKLIIKKSKFIESSFLSEKSKILIDFFGSNFFSNAIEILKFNVKVIISRIRFIFLNKTKINYINTLSIATDQINSECAERHFPHWLNHKTLKNQVIINNLNFNVTLSKKFLKANNISILGNKNILYLPNKSFKIEYIGEIYSNVKLHIKKLIYLTKGLTFLINKYNCNKFIYCEPQDPISDAILLSKLDYNIETFCIQYSNMCSKTPLMITCVDNFLCFSKEHEPVFKWEDIGPKNFISTGYTFINNYDNNNLEDLKQKLYNEGVKTIIAYFDESMQKDKWGYKSYQSCIDEYELLSNFIIENKSFAIILKPQFVRNSVSIFKSNKIMEAIKTNRLLEVKSGTHRNLITPQHVGAISDYSISDIIGGTAGLEAGLAGSKVFFINPSGYISMLKDIYNETGILVDDTQTVLNLILQKNKDQFSNEIINKLSKKEVSIQDALGL